MEGLERWMRRVRVPGRLLQCSLLMRNGHAVCQEHAVPRTKPDACSSPPTSSLISACSFSSDDTRPDGRMCSTMHKSCRQSASPPRFPHHHWASVDGDCSSLGLEFVCHVDHDQHAAHSHLIFLQTRRRLSRGSFPLTLTRLSPLIRGATHEDSRAPKTPGLAARLSYDAVGFDQIMKISGLSSD